MGRKILRETERVESRMRLSEEGRECVCVRER